MFGKLLALFIGLPLIELIILVKLGEVFGFWPTIGLVVITGIVGASLAKAQGFMVYNRIQQELSVGRIPTDQLVDGLLVLIGGVVLLTPGLLTDVFGFCMLIPPVRNFAKGILKKRFSGMVQRGQANVVYRNIGTIPPESE